MTSLNSAPVIRGPSSFRRAPLLLLSLTCNHSPDSFTSSTSSLQRETVHVRRVAVVAAATCPPLVIGIVGAARKPEGMPSDEDAANIGDGAGAGGETKAAVAQAEERAGDGAAAILGGEGAADDGAATETEGSLVARALIGSAGASASAGLAKPAAGDEAGACTLARGCGGDAGDGAGDGGEPTGITSDGGLVGILKLTRAPRTTCSFCQFGFGEGASL